MKKSMAQREREVLTPIANTHGVSLESLTQMVQEEAKRRVEMGEDLEETHIALLERMRVRFDAAVRHYTHDYHPTYHRVHTTRKRSTDSETTRTNDLIN